MLKYLMFSKSFAFDNILHVKDYVKYSVKTIDKIYISKVDKYYILRYWIYKFLENDMAKLFKENKD